MIFMIVLTIWFFLDKIIQGLGFTYEILAYFLNFKQFKLYSDTAY